ncbi:hypothetical protein [Nitratireductor sp. XY-223]|uniref:hypothetical protein n=1 Tax=Nitratireductor sp. XY-223 TaxID=2561926 RepID=UPI0010AA5F3A|nr:hypothetical protein [Nitratireductor sp. XY-223]
MKRILVVLVAIYIIGYLTLRIMNSEVWDEDGRTYVIYPEGAIALYYVFRPAAYVDDLLTGTGAHIGPHQ